MNLVQILTLIYIGLGIAAGYVSNFFDNRLLSVLISFLIYMVAYVILIKAVAYKKRSWLVTNSLITFILVWLVVWIFLFNTR